MNVAVTTKLAPVAEHKRPWPIISFKYLLSSNDFIYAKVDIYTNRRQPESKDQNLKRFHKEVTTKNGTHVVPSSLEV